MGSESSLAAGEDEVLAAGWEDGLPSSDSLLLTAVRNHVGQLRALATTEAYELLEDTGVVAAPSGLPHPFVNIAVMTAPGSSEAGDAALRSLESWAADRPGVPFLLMCPFGSPDLRVRGHAAVGHPPLMVRLPGGGAVEGPADVDVVEATDAAALATFEETVVDAYPLPELAGCAPGSVLPSGVLDTDWRFWVAQRADGTVLGTVAAFTGDGTTVLEYVSVTEAGRGGGVGAALAATATAAAGDDPAMLVASDMGRPVYERLGYLAVLRFPVWIVTG